MWWEQAVIYQVYVRSFQDTNGDGVGDLPGVTQRLGHIAELGAQAVWLSPIYPSPNADFGYDVSDFRSVDPAFGTLEDLDALVSRAGELGLKVLLDFVPCHTSTRAPVVPGAPRLLRLGRRARTTGARHSAGRHGAGTSGPGATSCTRSSPSRPT